MSFDFNVCHIINNVFVGKEINIRTLHSSLDSKQFPHIINDRWHKWKHLLLINGNKGDKFSNLLFERYHFY